MEVRIKLMGMLRAKAPANNVLELSEGATVSNALQALEIPTNHVHLTMVNGEQAHDRTRQLASGDELMVFPPVAGG